MLVPCSLYASSLQFVRHAVADLQQCTAAGSAITTSLNNRLHIEVLLNRSSPAMAPHTAAMPAFPMSNVVRLRDSLINGSSAAGLNVEIQAQKKDDHACKYTTSGAK